MSPQERIVAHQCFWSRFVTIFGTFYIFRYLWQSGWVTAAMGMDPNTWFFLAVLIGAAYTLAALAGGIVLSILSLPMMFRLMGPYTSPWQVRAQFAELHTLSMTRFTGIGAIFAPATAVTACVQFAQPDGWPVVTLIVGSLLSLLSFVNRVGSMSRMPQ